MWQDDLYGLSKKDLESVIARVCSDYGTVIRLMVHAAQAYLNWRAFALVDMSEAKEAERLATAFERTRAGTAVLLPLKPRPAS